MKRSHMILMIACCALPLLALAALPLFGVPLKGSWVLLLATLICPLSHLLLMRGMHDAEGAQGEHAKGQARPPRKAADIHPVHGSDSGRAQTPPHRHPTRSGVS